MSDSVPSPLTSGNLQFVSHQIPALKSGDYTIHVKQTVTAKGVNQTFEPTHRFSVQGPRFTLSPSDIHSVFPPAGSLGDHDNVLPHIALHRSTLPWDREVWHGQKTDQPKHPLPWLVLLVIYEDEQQAGRVLGPTLCALETLTQKSPLDLQIDSPQIDEPLGSDQATTNPAATDLAKTPDRVWWPTIELERSQHPSDRVSVIDVERSLLETLLPTSSADLSYLAHVRRYAEDGDSSALAPSPESIGKESIDKDVALIIANRLPKKKGTTTVHLVSLEHRHNANGETHPLVLPETVGATDYVRLVTLKSWQFSCVSSQYSFHGLLTRLNGVNGSHSGPTPREMLLRPSASDHQPALNAYLNKGHLPLPHHMRKGDNLLSWYHGPLIPGRVSIPHKTIKTHPAFPQTADQLLCEDPATGLFDVSYAAAWQLGQLLTLQNKRLSTILSAWKQLHCQTCFRSQQFEECCHVVAEQDTPQFAQQQTMADDERQEAMDWFKTQLGQLKTIPFNYLVPDESMLPRESIRFFVLDLYWVGCLIKGALSLSGAADMIPVDLQKELSQYFLAQDQRHGVSQRPLPNGETIDLASHTEFTGFLLRSEVVEGYPGLMVAGYDEDHYLYFASALADQGSDVLEADELDMLTLALDKPIIVIRRAGQGDRYETYRLAKPANPGAAQLLTFDPKQDNDLVDALEDGLQHREIPVSMERALLAKAKTTLGVLNPNLEPLTQHRQSLSENTLMCTFDGNVTQVDLYQQPETLHFGFKRTSDSQQPPLLAKELRHEDTGRELDNEPVLLNASTVDEPNKTYSTSTRVINMSTLAQTISAALSPPASPDTIPDRLTSAQLAMQLVEGSPLVSIYKTLTINSYLQDSAHAATLSI